MNPLLIYMIKAGISLSAFYLIYILTLSKDTFYSRNRIFLLGTALISMILPAVVIHTDRPLGGMLAEVLVYASAAKDNVPVPVEKEFSPINAVNFIFFTGILLNGLRLLVNLTELFVLIIRKKDKNSRIIIFKNCNTSGFTAMGHIFLKAGLDPEEENEILRHEQHHLEQRHFADILLFEIIKVLQWFNPVVYLADRSLRAIHEYQADECCLKKGIEIISYQKLLMNQVLGSRVFVLTNCFSHPKLLRKRMTMMTRKRSEEIVNLKLLLVLPVIVFILAAFSSGTADVENAAPPAAGGRNVNSIKPPQVLPLPPENTTVAVPVKTAFKKLPEPEPFVVVEEMPQFPGGQIELLRYINQQVVYPSSAKEQNIQGRVIIRFAVSSRGKVEKTTVLKGVHPDLDNEALRVVNSLPDFRPGMQSGKAVPVWYMVPITFTLK